jgi:hypothetical protein
LKFHLGLSGCDAFGSIIFDDKECNNFFEYFPFSDEGETILSKIGKPSLNIKASYPQRLEA